MEKSLRMLVFDFFSDLIEDQHSANIIGHLMVLFQYVQIYAAQFIPFLFFNAKRTRIDSFVSVVIFFSKASDQFFSEIYVLYIIWVFYILIFWCFFWTFRQKIRIKGVFVPIRNLLKFFPSILFQYPLLGHAALKMHQYINDKLYWYDLLMILLDLFIYFQYIIFEYYLTPVVSDSPLSSHAYIPSKVVPDFGFTIFLKQGQFAFFILVSSQNNIIKYFYCAFQIFMSAVRILVMAKSPLYSIIYNNISIALSFTMIFIQVCYLLSTRLKFLGALNVLILSLIFFVLAFLIVGLLMNINFHHIHVAIEENNFKYLKKIDPQKLFQIIITDKNLGKKNIIKFLRKRSKGELSVIMRIVSRKYIKDLDLLIETNSFICSFMIYRQIRKENMFPNPPDPSLQCDSDMFWYRMLKGETDEVMHDIIKFSKTNVFPFRDVIIENPLQANLRKLMKRGNPPVENSLYIITFLLLLSYSLVLIFPLFRLSSVISKITHVPGLLRKSLNIGIMWSNIMLGIEHSINCTMFNNMTFNYTIQKLKINTPEQYYVVETSTGDFNKEMKTIALSMTSEIVDMNKNFNDLLDQKFIERFENLWFKPTIIFPLHTGQKQTYMDMRGIMFYYLAEVAAYHDSVSYEEDDNWCHSQLTNHFNDHFDTFMNISMELLMSYTSFVNIYLDYITSTAEKYKVDTSLTQFVLCVIFFVASLVTNLLWTYLNYSRLFSTIKDYFRISIHPVYDDIEREEDSSAMNVQWEMFINFIIHFGLGILFFIIVQILKTQSDVAYNTMMKYNMISVRFENLSLVLSIMIHAYFRSYLFEDPIYIEQYESRVYDLEFVIQKLGGSFSALNLKRFNDMSNLPAIMQDQDKNLELKSFHDLYNMWPIHQLCNLLNSLITDTQLFPLNPDSSLFLHLNHINLAHFQPGINHLHDEVSQYSDDQSKLIYLLIVIGAALFCVFFVFIFYSLYKKYLMFEKCYKVLNTHILKLDPMFLLTQSCLIEYLIGSKKDNTESIKNMKDLLNELGVPVIFVGTAKNTIIEFTKPILDMFGRREDQLIGHKLRTLIHDENKNFFRHVHNRVASTHSITGINANDEVFTVEVSITPLRSFAILQFKIIDDIMMIEELIQVHNDLFNEFFSSAYPSYITQQAFSTYPNIYETKLSRFSFLLMTMEIQSGETDPNFEVMKQYFSEAFVLFHSCSLWCIIFPGDTHTVEAIKCYQDFGWSEEKKAGVIIDGYDLPVMFLGLFEDFNWDDIEYIMTSMTPFISIEPKFNIFEYFQNINNLVMGQLISSKSMARFFEDSTITYIDNDFIMITNLDVAKIDFFDQSASSFAPYFLS